jgi:hypothetical protein
MTHTDLSEVVGIPPEVCKRLKKDCYVPTAERLVFCCMVDTEWREETAEKLGVSDATMKAWASLAKAHVLALTEFKTYVGELEGFFETGSEGVHWMMYEDGKKGYEGLQAIEDYDHLVVTAADGTMLFDGEIEWDWKVGYQPYPMNPKLGQQCALGMWVHGIQKGWEPDEWGKLFFPLQGEPERPAHRAVLTKKPPSFDRDIPER